MASSEEAPTKCRQYLIALLANIVSFAAGTTTGWSSPVALKLASNNTDETPLGTTISTLSEEYAWISSLLLIGTLIAPFGAGFLSEKIGRRWTLFLAAIMIIVASILFIFAYHISILYIGRIVQGCGLGFTITIQPLYMAEIATDNVRPTVGTFLSLFIVAGTTFVQVIGVYISYYSIQYACLAPPILYLLIFYFIPESPIYLMAKGRKEEAIKSLAYLQCQPPEKLEEEIKKIEDLVKVDTKKKGSLLAIVKDRANLRAFFIGWGLITFRQLTGVNTVIYNMQVILERANTGIDIGILTIIAVVLLLAATTCSPVVATHFGRRIILLVTMSLLCIGLFCLGIYFYLDSVGADTSTIFWLPIVSFAVYMGAISVGFMPISVAIIGEIFSTETKSAASAILNVNEAIVSFLLTRFYPAMRAIGEYFAFWLFTVLSVIGLVFIFVFVIETKGLSLKDIQDKLNSKSNRN